MGFNSGFKGLTQVLDGDEFSTSRPGRFIPKKTRYPLNRWLSGLQSSSGLLVEQTKSVAPAGIRIHYVHLVTRSLYILRCPGLYDKILKISKKYLNMWSAYLQFELIYVKPSAGTTRFPTSCTVCSHTVAMNFARKGKKRITPVRTKQLTANKSSFRHSSLTELHFELKLFISSSDSQTQVLIRYQKENNTLHLYGNTCHVLDDRCTNKNNFL